MTCEPEVGTDIAGCAMPAPRSIMSEFMTANRIYLLSISWSSRTLLDLRGLNLVSTEAVIIGCCCIRITLVSCGIAHEKPLSL